MSRFAGYQRSNVSKMQYKTDHPHIGKWAAPLGELIINCTALEGELARWIVQMSERAPTQTNLHNIAALKYSEKSKQLKKYITERASSPAWRASAEKLFNKADSIVALRNQAVHNPIFFSWNSVDEEGPPDAAFMSSTGSAKRRKAKGLTLDNLRTATNQAERLVREAETLRKEWCELRDADKVPPPIDRLSLLKRIQKSVMFAIWRFKHQSGEN